MVSFQAGYSWFNIIFTILVTIEGIVYEECFNYVCVVDNDGPSTQDCSMVVAIFDKCIKHFKGAQKHVTRLYLKSDNAANLKNEILIRYLKDLNYTPNSQVEPIKAIGYVPSVAMDGKDDADKLAALCNAKIDQEVNSGFSIDSPRHQAEAIWMNGGLANTIVLFGKIVGKQPPLENKQIPTISKIGEFDFQPDGTVNIRRVASIGPGKDITLDEPFNLVPEYRCDVMNKNQLSEDGVPFKTTRNPLDKTKKKNLVTNQPSGDTVKKKLNVMEHIRYDHLQKYGIDGIHQFQPDVDIGAASLLQNLDFPAFSENLLQLQTGTKWTHEHWTLKNLEVGHALPVWGSGTNKATEKVKNYLRKLFMEGEPGGEGKVQAPDAYQRMQEELDPVTGAPLFNADEFQTLDQIKGFNSSTKRTRKISIPSTAKRQAASASTTTEDIAGLDFVDSSNEAEQQALEQEMRDMSATEGAVAMRQEALQIQAALDNSDDDPSDPIMVGKVNLCAMAELINVCVGKPLEKLSLDEKQAITSKVVANEARWSMVAKNTRQLTKAIMVFVRRECPYQSCGHLHR